MSEPAPSSPPAHPTPGPGLSQEELAERELMAIMSSSPALGLQTSDDDEVDELALDQEPIVAPIVSAASIRNDLVVARRKAIQFKLHPYQRDAVEDFAKSSSALKQIMLFIQLCAVENHINSIKMAAPPFSSSPQLIENIKSFVVAVLLSSKLSAYKKNSVPVDLVMKILTSVPRSYVPEDLAGDSFAFKIVKSDIQEELTQARSRIKKAIRDSLDILPKESQTIYDLATNIVTNSKSSVTVSLCARIALLRKIYVEAPDSTYWDKVDKRLLLIRTTANGVPGKVSMAFEIFLQADRDKYGDKATYSLSASVTDDFQNSVDVVIGTSES